MPKFNHLYFDPPTRINDLFSLDDRIDASPVSVSERHPMIQTLPNSENEKFQADFYQYIACDIVVETTFDYPYPYITEKTLRPIACKRMFIVVGPTGILSHLRTKGFQTFGDIIDETYDSIADPIDRFLEIKNQIYRFCDRPLEEILQYLHNNKHKFKHNFDNLMSMQSKELDELRKNLA